MPKRSQQELEEILKEQLHLLTKSCKSYDEGDELEAIRIAGHLRTILHQTTDPNSLLELLGLRSTLTVYDSAIPEGTFGGFKIGPGSRNLNITGVPSTYYAGLVCKEIQGNGNNITLLKCSAQLEVTFLKKKIDFNDWWDKQVVFNDGIENTLTRKEIVTLIANKDGYSHVNENPPKKYIVFKNTNAIQFGLNGQITSPENVPVYPAVRQISFEFINALFEQYPKFKTNYS
jgi:hypothetical protein